MEFLKRAGDIKWKTQSGRHFKVFSQMHPANSLFLSPLQNYPDLHILQAMGNSVAINHLMVSNLV